MKKFGQWSPRDWLPLHFCYPNQKIAFSEKRTVWLLIFSTSHVPNLNVKNFRHGRFFVEIKRSELRMESVFLYSACKVPIKEKLPLLKRLKTEPTLCWLPSAFSLALKVFLVLSDCESNEDSTSRVPYLNVC